MDLDYILGFAALLGILIFIHELGHFLVAKWSGIRVETFSIGMGKKILKFTKGDTEYALSLIPIGGYVKLTGQDSREEVPEQFKAQSFRSKPLFKRAAVVLAGPLFNAVLAYFIFVSLFYIGKGNQVMAPVLERVLVSSPAFEAGFRTGDRITEIESADGKIVRPRELPDLVNTVGENAGNPLKFSIERKGETSPVTIHYTPEEKEVKDLFLQVPKVEGTIVGAERTSRMALLYIRPDTVAYNEGIRTGFLLERVDLRGGPVTESFEIKRFSDLELAWDRIATISRSLPDAQLEFHGAQMLDKDLKPIPVKDDSEAPKVAATISWTANRQPDLSSLQSIGLYSAEMLIAEVVKETPAEKLGLQAGDFLLKLNQKPIESFDSFRSNLQFLSRNDKKIELTWMRNGQEFTGEVTARKTMAEDPVTKAKSEQFQIGARFIQAQGDPHMDFLKARNVWDALCLGAVQTSRMTGTMLKSFYHLFNQDISVKTLGGPLKIGQIAGESVKRGARAFFSMMAFISLNLFVLNLLPIPILDGGHLILYIFEAVFRREPNQKFIEVWTTAGFLALMTLMVVVTFNDIKSMILSRM
jgi:regulator of sigma E protease